jgi:uncharacterized protein (TIGR01777 family)
MPENNIPGNVKKSASVLISGGSGLVGKYLTSTLLAEGYKVSHLSRNVNQFGKVRVFRWDPVNKIVDPVIFDGIDYIIQLSGANIGEKRWTPERKEEIIGSRVESTLFLHKVISENNIMPKAFISASATGYYGSITSDKIYYEDDPPATDFLGNTCRLWEEATDRFEKTGIRTVKIRTSVVLEKNEGALPKLMMSGKYGFLVRIGKGRQYIPWIHISDLCSVYLRAISDSNMIGAYNAVSPHHVTHKDFMSLLSQIMKKPVFPIPVPPDILRAFLGEKADVILKGSRVSCDKLKNAGFSFLYGNLEDALNNII